MGWEEEETWVPRDSYFGGRRPRDQRRWIKANPGRESGSLGMEKASIREGLPLALLGSASLLWPAPSASRPQQGEALASLRAPPTLTWKVGAAWP